MAVKDNKDPKGDVQSNPDNVEGNDTVNPTEVKKEDSSDNSKEDTNDTVTTNTTSDELSSDDSSSNNETENNVEESKSEVDKIENVDLDKVFKPGDKIVVNYKIIEGDKSRVQPFEGIVISKRGSGISKTFTVRRVSSGGIGVERIFQTYSPNIDSVNVKVEGKVRRAKLYYMRNRVGKAATKVKEKKSN